MIKFLTSFIRVSLVTQVHGLFCVFTLKYVNYPHTSVIFNKFIFDILLLLLFILCVFGKLRIFNVLDIPNFNFIPQNSTFPVAAQSNVWVCFRSVAGIVGSNPAGGMTLCLLWVLCFGLITHLYEPKRARCVWVWSRNLNNEEAQWVKFYAVPRLVLCLQHPCYGSACAVVVCSILYPP
jgi:hypothetical protein